MYLYKVKALKYVYIWLTLKARKLYLNTSSLDKESQ